MSPDFSPVPKAISLFRCWGEKSNKSGVWELQSFFIKEKEKKSSMIKCNMCNQWQHASCAGVKISDYNDKFKCDNCR